MLTESLTYKQITKFQFLQITGHILDPYCTRLSNAGPLCKNYGKFYFDATHLEKGLNRGEGGGGFVPFLANIDHCPKFLEYALNK